MTSSRRHLPALALVAAIALTAPPAAAGAPPAPPCGGVKLVEGRVDLGHTLRFADVRSPEADACFAAIARALAERPKVRSVLVSARVDGGEAARKEAADAARHVAGRLAAHGLPSARVFTVVPRAAPLETDSVRISFVERRPFRAAAQLFAASGKVHTGHGLESLTPASPGAVLASQQLIETAPGSVATVHLVDGSRLRLAPESLVRLGDITAPGSARRDVHVELLRGRIHVRASRREGPLRVTTLQATVSVQGTAFRVALTEENLTRVETLSGTVSLAGPRGQVFVARGEGSLVDAGGYPSEPRPLLLPPRIVAPVFGPRADGELLLWEPVPQAVSYQVEFARNAQFDDAAWETTAAGDRMLVNAAHRPGKWFWRVTAVDPAGFEGFASKIYAFEVPAPGP